MKPFYLSILFAFLLLSGCSSNSGSSSSNKVAHHVEGPVEGVSYSCDSIGGITDHNGSFEYQDGCTVSFSIGGITLGEILASDINTIDIKVYISEFFGLERNNISDPTLIQVLQILQTPDEDNIATNGIEIAAQSLSVPVWADTLAALCCVAALDISFIGEPQYSLLSPADSTHLFSKRKSDGFVPWLTVCNVS